MSISIDTHPLYLTLTLNLIPPILLWKCDFSSPPVPNAFQDDNLLILHEVWVMGFFHLEVFAGCVLEPE